MRPIKFRGLSDNNIFVYGYLTQDVYGNFLISSCENGKVEFRNVHTPSIGQFTGLHDCNGVEIYEGDILDIEDSGITFEVAWSDEDACFCIERKSHEVLLSVSKARIIGTVYQNQELLQ